MLIKLLQAGMLAQGEIEQCELCLQGVQGPKLGAISMPDTFVNSIGIRFVQVEPGSFMMGQGMGGNYDERPVHRVTITRGFYMGVTEVTNVQYEQFDPAHKKLRGFSKRDDEAVVFVSWYDAMAFCKWLTEKEGQPYRLPTEGEWEYACRAGTSSVYHTGDDLDPVYYKNQLLVPPIDCADPQWQETQRNAYREIQQQNWVNCPSLQVAGTPANLWGLHDMHGNMEEWCYDWYGFYPGGENIDPDWCYDWYGPHGGGGFTDWPGQEQTDPVGRVSGLYKVTRGGSHSTQLQYLRSANRSGALPEDNSQMIGFRLVQGELPETKPLPESEPISFVQDVLQEEYDWSHGSDGEKVFFKGPISYVRAPVQGSGVPMMKHNHNPTLTFCSNGDLIAQWMSTGAEVGREKLFLASRLRAGRQQWDRPSLFFNPPDRCVTGSSFFYDGQGRIVFIGGVGSAAYIREVALVLTTSGDSGATWSVPRIIIPHEQPYNAPISGAILTLEGYLLLPCDASAKRGTAIYISCDDGKTWIDPAAGQGKPIFDQDQVGGYIAGIHAGIVQLADGSLMALGRDSNIQGRMPMSISNDMGKSWTYSASEFPPIAGGQRLVLMRLSEGPILLISFTDSSSKRDNPAWPSVDGISICDIAGKERRVYGMFAVVSFDEGKSWPVKKLITAGNIEAKRYGGPWGEWSFAMDATHSEHYGYLTATQSPDGVIHLLSSTQHYQFNLAWLKEKMAAG